MQKCLIYLLVQSHAYMQQERKACNLQSVHLMSLYGAEMENASLKTIYLEANSIHWDVSGYILSNFLMKKLFLFTELDLPAVTTVSCAKHLNWNSKREQQSEPEAPLSTGMQTTQKQTRVCVSVCACVHGGVCVLVCLLHACVSSHRTIAFSCKSLNIERVKEAIWWWHASSLKIFFIFIVENWIKSLYYYAIKVIILYIFLLIVKKYNTCINLFSIKFKIWKRQTMTR